jgi:hypothetical protein
MGLVTHRHLSDNEVRLGGLCRWWKQESAKRGGREDGRKPGRREDKKTAVLCEDQEVTGFSVHKKPASCAKLAFAKGCTALLSKQVPPRKV